jgi:hypothetical protein
MNLYFIANNKNVKGLEELKEKTFETYLNTFPQSSEGYSVIEHFNSKAGEFVMKVKIENKPGFYVSKGVIWDKEDYPRLENDVFLSILIQKLNKIIKLDHPNIVKHHTWFKEIYFDERMKKEMVKYTSIMDYADGGDLLGYMNSTLKYMTLKDHDWNSFYFQRNSQRIETFTFN